MPSKTRKTTSSKTTSSKTTSSTGNSLGITLKPRTREPRRPNFRQLADLLLRLNNPK